MSRAATRVRAPATSESLLRVMGTFGLAAAIVNITVGGGIFRLPAIVAGALGPAAPMAYLVCAVAMALIVLCIADAGSRVSLTGGPYAYIGVALGPYAGFLSGVLLWMLGLFATAAVSTVFAASVGQLVPALAGRAMQIVVLVGGVRVLVAREHARRGPGRAAEHDRHASPSCVPLVLLAVGGLFFVRAENLAIAAWPAAGDVARTSLLLDLRVRGHRVGARAERRSARHGAHRAAGHRAGDARHHGAVHRAAGVGAGHPRRRAGAGHGVAAGRRRGHGVRRLGARAAAGRRVGVDVRLPGRHDALDAAHGVRARPRRVPAARARRRPSRAPHAAGGHRRAVARSRSRSPCRARSSAWRSWPTCRRSRSTSAARWRRGGCDRAAPARRRACRWRGIAPFLAVPVILWLLTGLTRDEWLGFGACVAVGSLAYVVARGRRACRRAVAPGRRRVQGRARGETARSRDGPGLPDHSVTIVTPGLRGSRCSPRTEECAQPRVQRAAEPPAGAPVDEPQFGEPGKQRRIERIVDARQRLFDPQPVQVHFRRRRAAGPPRPALRRRPTTRFGSGPASADTAFCGNDHGTLLDLHQQPPLFRTSRTTPLPNGVCTVSPAANRAAMAVGTILRPGDAHGLALGPASGTAPGAGRAHALTSRHQGATVESP